MEGREGGREGRLGGRDGGREGGREGGWEGGREGGRGGREGDLTCNDSSTLKRLWWRNQADSYFLLTFQIFFRISDHFFETSLGSNAEAGNLFRVKAR